MKKKGKLLQQRIKNREKIKSNSRLLRNSLAWPIKGKFRISQLFGQNPQMYRPLGLKAHNGIDVAVPVGTPIYALDYGVVDIVKADVNGYGLHVKIKHDWGQSTYAHLQSFCVKPPCYVTKGQKIGMSNNTGFSTGPHLHFDIKMDGKRNPGYYDRVDPWRFMQVDGHFKKKGS